VFREFVFKVLRDGIDAKERGASDKGVPKAREFDRRGSVVGGHMMFHGEVTGVVGTLRLARQLAL
jgi:hypothetical protein